MRSRDRVALLLGLTLTLGACRSDGDNIEALLEAGFADPQPAQDWHQGPPVEIANTGPARYVPALLEAFDADRAMETVAFTDQFYRAPVNDGYLAVLDHLHERLEEAGYGGADERLELREIVADMATPAWTPRAALIEIKSPGKAPIQLHEFHIGTESDRTILPLGAPPCDVTGRVRFSLGDLEAGDILVTNADLGQVFSRAKKRGAAAIISSFIETFNVDPTGADRDHDAIRYLRLPEPSTLPVAQISRRSFETIHAAAIAANDGLELHYRADIDLEKRSMRTLVAAIRGAERPDECVVSAAHIQEPGAGDNASGVGALLEGAVSLAGALNRGAIDWPDRTLVFVWGDEYAQTETWIKDTKRTPIAGISSDMVGNSPSKTGARALLERNPDPGAMATLKPDEHTPWGHGDVRRSMLHPNALAVIARCAMVDVGLAAGGWACADHPWEGGSDHDVFIFRAIPAVLLWHFTDFSYHTSLDRMDMVDGDELERTEVVILATMLAVADPRPIDLDRYIRSIEMERRVRVEAAEAVGKPTVAQAWVDWCRGAVGWARAECLDIPIEEATPPLVPVKSDTDAEPK
jgi:hypothetical protein